MPGSWPVSGRCRTSVRIADLDPGLGGRRAPAARENNDLIEDKSIGNRTENVQ
jgi:hypothetical protein